jgi:raffinose/stachyose/melibiose transport system substrate-binding protein
VVQVNQGLSDMGALVKAGLLLDLTAYAEQYGWVEKLSQGIVTRNSFTADGATFGEGNLYGVPPVAELIGVFYNKQIFEDAGLSVPTTFAEFEAALETLKAAGVTPIVFGNLDAWPAIHTYSEIQNALIDRAYLDDFIFGRSEAGFDTPENLQAAQTLAAWVDAGYFTPFFEGIGYDDSWRLFGEGEGAMILTGSWISGELLNMAEPDAFGFFLTPPVEAGAPRMSVGGTSLAYGIRATTANPDLAAEYIDWMMSPRAAELWIEAGFVPVQPVGDDAVAEGTLFADLVSAWRHLNETDGVGHYLDWATPTFYDTITSALQELLGKQITPEEFVTRLHEDYMAFVAEKAE